MTGKKFLDFISRAAPGGVVHSDDGVTIEISSNGTSSTVPDEALERVLFKRFNEMHPQDSNAASETKASE